MAAPWAAPDRQTRDWQQGEAQLHNLLVVDPMLHTKLHQHKAAKGAASTLPPVWHTMLDGGPLGTTSEWARARLDGDGTRPDRHTRVITKMPRPVPFADQLALLAVFDSDSRYGLYYQFPGRMCGDRGFWRRFGEDSPNEPERRVRNALRVTVAVAKIRARLRWRRTVLLVLRFKRWALKTYDEVHHRPEHYHCDEAAKAADMADAFGAEVSAHVSAVEEAEAASRAPKRPRVCGLPL